MKHKPSLLIAACSALLLMGLLGCGKGEPSAEEVKKLNNDFAQKEFDINKVPPEQREMVKGMMENQKKGAASASASAPASK